MTLAAVTTPYGNNDTDCSIVRTPAGQAAGPKVVVPARSTVTLNFPQPFLTKKIEGYPSNKVCLVAWGEERVKDVTWSAVGYTGIALLGSAPFLPLTASSQDTSRIGG